MIPPELLHATYLNLSTLRKNGMAVDTPVWFAHNGKQLFVLSAGNAGKIKRLRNNPCARIAQCDYAGDLLGPWHDVKASLLAPHEIPQAHDLFVRKYGWQMRAFDFFSRLGGRYPKRAYIRLQTLP